MFHDNLVFRGVPCSLVVLEVQALALGEVERNMTADIEERRKERNLPHMDSLWNQKRIFGSVSDFENSLHSPAFYPQ